MRDNERIENDQLNDTTIAQLLTHLQQLRRTVPVNYQLKAELKQKLLQRMKELEASKSASAQKARFSRKTVWGIATLALLIVAAALFAFGSKGSINLEEHAFFSVPAEASIETVGLSTKGDRVAFIGMDGKLYTRSTKNDKDKQIFTLPKTEGIYQSLAWSADDQQIALVELQNNTARLWMLDVPVKGRSGSSRLLREEKGVLYSNPSWSPGNAEVAYTRIINGKEEIWVNSTLSFQERKIAEGSQPTWSPSGNELAFVKDGTVSIMNLTTGEIQTVAKGSWPSWEASDRLTFTAPGNQLVETSVDQPTFDIHPLSLPQSPGEKVVRANWAKNGKQLLIAYETEKMYLFSIASRN